METDGYTGPGKVAKVLAESQGDRRDIRVLDVAAGTGLCGEEVCMTEENTFTVYYMYMNRLRSYLTAGICEPYIKNFDRACVKIVGCAISLAISHSSSGLLYTSQYGKVFPLFVSVVQA